MVPPISYAHVNCGGELDARQLELVKSLIVQE